MSLRTSHSAFHYVPVSLNKALDLLPMLQAVSAGLILLQPWILTDRDKFPAKIEPFVDRVRGQSEKYHEALTDSAQVAQIGFDWTLDMEIYCTVLKRGSGNNEFLNKYVKLMREGARNAQRQAEEVSGKFHCVSAALRHIVTDAENVAKLSARTITLSDAQIQENTEKWEKGLKRGKTFVKVCSASTATMIVGSIFLGPIPFLATAAGAAIGTGLTGLMLKADENLNDDKMIWGIAKKFGIRAENSPVASEILSENSLAEAEVLQYLAAAVGGIELIVKHLDVVAKWWGDMHTELKGIEASGLERLDGNKGTMSVVLMEDAIASVQESIKERKEEFKEYINQVHDVQARNPPPRIY